MSEAERLAWLEKLGYVPDFADMPRDWMLAEKTSWWGKPLDPKKYHALTEQGNQIVITNFFGRLAVDPKYVTNSLTHDQIQAASAWKIAWPPGTELARSHDSLEFVIGPGGTLILEVLS